MYKKCDLTGCVYFLSHFILSSMHEGDWICPIVFSCFLFFFSFFFSLFFSVGGGAAITIPRSHPPV